MVITIFRNLIVLLCINSIGYSQDISGSIDYVVSLDTKNALKKLDGSSADQSTKNDVRQSFKSADDFRIKLLFNSKVSLSKGVVNLENDNKRQGIQLTKLMSGGNDLVYSILKSDSTLIERSGYGNVLILSKPLNWNLSKETKLIGNKVCFKATAIRTVENSSGITKDEIIAWYTKEISLPLGPYIYNGLPGLILELSSNNGLILFRVEKINLNLKEGNKIKVPKRNIISEEEATRIAKENFYSIIKD